MRKYQLLTKKIMFKLVLLNVHILHGISQPRSRILGLVAQSTATQCLTAEDLSKFSLRSVF